jgi:hypothetical protein
MTSPSPVQPSAFDPQTAAPAPTAFPGLVPQSMAVNPAPEPAPVVSAPVPGSEPPAPVAAQPPAIDPRAYEEGQRAKRQLEELQNQIRTEFAAAQARQEQEQAQNQLKSQREQIYQNASTLYADDPVKAMEYIRRNEDTVLAQALGRVEQVRQQMTQQTQAMLMQVAAPLYAQDLARQHNLLPEYAQQLASYPPQMIDQMLPMVKQAQAQEIARKSEIEQMRAQLEQFTRSTQAAAVQQTGAHELSGTGASPVPPTTGQIEPGSLDHLMSIPGFAELIAR